MDNKKTLTNITFNEAAIMFAALDNFLPNQAESLSQFKKIESFFDRITDLQKSATGNSLSTLTLSEEEIEILLKELNKPIFTKRSILKQVGALVDRIEKLKT